MFVHLTNTFVFLVSVHNTQQNPALPITSCSSSQPLKFPLSLIYLFSLSLHICFWLFIWKWSDLWLGFIFLFLFVDWAKNEPSLHWLILKTELIKLINSSLFMYNLPTLILNNIHFNLILKLLVDCCKSDSLVTLS